MLHQMTLWDTPSITSLPESEGGHMHCDVRDGRTTDLYGQDHVPVSPFSAAGKQKGFADSRHLWPIWFRLIRAYRPDIVFGEQVASRGGLEWFDAVSDDMEETGYTCGAVDICAAGFGAPHIRQRLYWVAYADHELRHRSGEDWTGRWNESSNMCIVGRLGDPSFCGNRALLRQSCTGVQQQESSGGYGFSDGMGNTVGKRLEGHAGYDYGLPVDGFWRDADWCLCRDGKWRPVEPGSSPLADGVPARMGRLRGYGNAIVVPQAEAFIKAFMNILW